MTPAISLGRILAETLLERQIEEDIVKAMALDGWRAFKMEENFSERKKKKTGEPGMCDHLFIRPIPVTANSVEPPLTEAQASGYGQVLFWEFKRKRAKKGRKALETTRSTPDQLRWQAEAKRQGFLVWVAGVDHPATRAGAARHYLESGFCRRPPLFEALCA